MESIKEKLNRIIDILKKPNQDSLNLSMSDTHHKGIFSLVIDGTEFGKLTRVFVAHQQLLPFEVQLHTHRYNIDITVIKGQIRHYVADILPDHVVPQADIQTMSLFDYKSPLNGGEGLRYKKDVPVQINEYGLPVGSTLHMHCNEYHTMSCSKGSIWIVEEQGFKSESSKVLGVPFVVDDLYNEPKSFQINDNFQIVKKAIKEILYHYSIV